MSLAPFSSGFGSTPFGVGAPVDGPAPPVGIPQLSRYLDPVTKDFSVDPTNGHLRTMPPVRQRFLLIIATLKGSSATLPELGLDFSNIIDDSFERRVDTSVRLSARQMTEIEKVARIDAVTVQTSALGRALILIAYEDLTLGITDTVSG